MMKKTLSRRQALKKGLSGILGLATAGSLVAPRIATATDKEGLNRDEVILRPHVSPNLHRDDCWKNVDWNTLRDEQDRLEYYDEILAHDQTDFLINLILILLDLKNSNQNIQIFLK